VAASQTGAAGGYADRRYKDGLRSWRSRARPYMLLLFGPFLIVGAAGGIAAGDIWGWLAGMSFGLGTGVWIVLRDSPPAYVENWQTGAEGERKTAAALHPLEREGWTILHDIDSGRGNYDHILIGAAGVFMLDSKKPNAEAYTRDGTLWLRRRHDPEADRPDRAIPAAALACAARLHDQLKQITGTAPWVHAVTVLWCVFPEGTCETMRHTLIHGENVTAWLQRQPPTLSPQRVVELVAAASQIAVAATTC
jgi:Nuclease-related domain